MSEEQPVGQRVQTPRGPGVVIGHREARWWSVRVRLDRAGGASREVWFSEAELQAVLT